MCSEAIFLQAGVEVEGGGGELGALTPGQASRLGEDVVAAVREGVKSLGKKGGKSKEMERGGGGGEQWGAGVITPGGDSRYWEEDDGVDARDEVRPDELEVQILDHKTRETPAPKKRLPQFAALSFRVVHLFCTVSCLWTRACGRRCLSSELEKNFSGKKLFNDFSSCHSLLTHACVRACVCCRWEICSASVRSQRCGRRSGGEPSQSRGLRMSAHKSNWMHSPGRCVCK